MTLNNEQWKSDGDCNLCRRQSYCNHLCKKKEARLTAEMLARVKEVMSKKQEDYYANQRSEE